MLNKSSQMYVDVDPSIEKHTEFYVSELVSQNCHVLLFFSFVKGNLFTQLILITFEYMDGMNI